MRNIILFLTIMISSIQILAQGERFFSSDDAIAWMPQLIGYNIEIIGEQNDKGFKSTDKEFIEFLFITDIAEKAQSLKKAINDKDGYQLYKEYALEGFWIVTGLTNEMSMNFDSFSKWTVDFCKMG